MMNFKGQHDLFSFFFRQNNFHLEISSNTSFNVNNVLTCTGKHDRRLPDEGLTVNHDNESNVSRMDLLEKMLVFK